MDIEKVHLDVTSSGKVLQKVSEYVHNIINILSVFFAECSPKRPLPYCFGKGAF